MQIVKVTVCIYVISALHELYASQGVCPAALVVAWLEPGVPRRGQHHHFGRNYLVGGNRKKFLTQCEAVKNETTSESKSSIVEQQSSLNSTMGVKQQQDRTQTANANIPNIPFGIVFDRTLDTVEDAFIHIRRLSYDFGWVDEPSDAKPTVVLLGSGWAAHALMKVADTYRIRLIVVSPINHFVFTPMLASASVGTVEYRSMTEAVRASNPMIHSYIEGHAVDVDITNQVVRVQQESLLADIRRGDPPVIEIGYDYLVVAVGCKVADSLVPGAFEYCLRLKTCDDARRLRTAVGECLEFASRPDVAQDRTLPISELERLNIERKKRATFAIIGGGPTGVELAGEIADFMRDVTKERVGTYPRLADDIHVILIHGGTELVVQFDPALRKHALYSLQREGVEVRLETSVMEVGDGYIVLRNRDGLIEKLDIGLSVWAAGTEPVPFVKNLLAKLPEEARGPRGLVVVDEWMRCPMPTSGKFGSVLILGDAASFADKQGNFLPQTAQVAGQQGAYAARLLCRGYDLSVTPPRLRDGDGMVNLWLKLRGLSESPSFSFLNLGLLAYVGGGQALSQIQIGEVPVASYAGSVSFVLWRSVYLVKQVATRNRVLVTFDWIKSYIFGRDITRL